MLKLSFKQQILTGFTVTLIFVFLSAIGSFLCIKTFRESASWVEHTEEVVRTTLTLENELINAETGMRGFVITEDHKYKQPYLASIDKIATISTSLRNMVSDNPSQAGLADSISYWADLKVQDMRQVMDKAETENFIAAKKQIKTDAGRNYKHAFLKHTRQFIGNEQKLLAVRKQNTATWDKITTTILILSSAIIFGLILFLLRYIRKTFDQQKETERQILLANTELERLSEENKRNNWLLTGAHSINQTMRGQAEVGDLANKILAGLCNYTGANLGVAYLARHHGNTLSLIGGYALTARYQDEIKLGQGLIGQCALDMRAHLIDELPNDYVKINSGLGETLPRALYLMPIVFEGNTLAVIELAFINKPDGKTTQLLENIAENIGIAIAAALAHEQLQELFEKTQQQAEELTSQQEELRATNEELMHKSEALQASEEELRVQQEELQQANAELEEKAQLLEERNVSINQAKEAITLKAEELEVSGKYKSEFLANMSHELRTPLNSILILARILKENRNANLNEEQIKYAGVIHTAGSDLLNLINDILDLSKIESGHVELLPENIAPREIKENIEPLFAELAKQKKINFNFELQPTLPNSLYTDLSRVQQVVKNLLSNAFKFTPENGAITVSIGTQNLFSPTHTLTDQEIKNPITIAVKDTGIGIAKDKQKLIFEAFKQEDGSTSRKYGGTGLGLSISRELAYLLGGNLSLDSQPGLGSTFTLTIPQRIEAKTEQAEIAETPNDTLPAQHIELPITTPTTSDKKRLLIVEDDMVFANVLKDYAQQKGFEPIVAYSGDKGLELAQSEKPDAIVLDVMLPVMDGWTILKRLKADSNTSNIPVHMMSAGDFKADRALKEGAIGFMKKPIEDSALEQAFTKLGTTYQYHFHHVLLIEDQVLQSDLLTEQLREKGVKVSQVYNGQDALELLKTEDFDGIILDLKLPDIDGLTLLDKIKADEKWKQVPIIINTAMELTKEQTEAVMKHTQAMVLKTSKSNDRLLDEVSLFMNKLQHKQAPAYKKNQSSNAATTIELALDNKNILIADDDMRNIFALSSALQAYNINVVIANNGLEALEQLKQHPEIDLVLMDIMMPEMDGYDAMQQIRAQKQFQGLPIIALTAKAMKNDREKCIQAGASDYIAKPVDVDKLLSMMRVWLS